MNFIGIDLEGVLVPEIWVSLSEKTGIKDLQLTTKDIKDYKELMRIRIELLNKNKIVYVKDNDVYVWKSKNIKKISGVHINKFKIANKNINIILNEMPFDKALKTYNDYLDFDRVV